MKIASFKALIWLSLVFVLAGFFVFFVKTPVALAGADDNIAGWAWSENIGWISFNNLSGGGGTDYGVNIDSGTGEFSGYAWSENIGWIDFAPSGPYPSAPNYSAKLDMGTREVSGWARALAFGGGWDGWIKMRGAGYGVSMGVDFEFEGWAWGSDVVGWISFNCSNSGVCATSNYKVSASSDLLNFPPSVTTGDAENPDGESSFPCISSRQYTLHWTFSDPDGDVQGAYQLQIDNNSNFSSPVTDTGIVESGSNSYTTGTSDLDWNTTYYWRVRVRDDRGAWSVDWSNTDNFITPKHAYPEPDFSYSPDYPSAGEEVQFTDETTFYDQGAGGKTWAWTFEDGEPATSGDQNPVVSFTDDGNKLVGLTATDKDGYSCSIEQSIYISLPFPDWREVSPR